MGALRDPAWKEWYRAQHELRSLATGAEFETYVTTVLAYLHPDFVNPDPAGSLGDWGADGLAKAGSILYACYGARPIQDAERKLGEKLEHDFTRARDQWPAVSRWRFVTNATFGPIASTYITDIQRVHGRESDRPIEIEVWKPDRLWTEGVAKLDATKLDRLFPGVPRAEHVELAEVVVLLDALDDGPAPETLSSIRPVPPTKMDWNALSAPARLEFNEGRLSHARIDEWFVHQADPDLRDRLGVRFRKVYEGHQSVVTDARDLLERLYVSAGGSDFRLDSRRANAVYAVTSYFFDSCDIFEEPPGDYSGGPLLAAAD
jgi:hypothetical protein